MHRTTTWILGILIAMGALAGLYGALKRYRVEARNRRVEITLDLEEVERLAQLTGRPIPKVLGQFKAAGVTSLAITENTLADLETQGYLHPERQGRFTLVKVSDGSIHAQIEQGLKARGIPLSTPSAEVRDPEQALEAETVFAPTSFTAQHGREKAWGFSCPVDYGNLRLLGVGLDPKSVEITKQAGLRPVGRINNFPGASPASMRSTLLDLKRQSIQTVVFVGTEVLGYRTLLREAAEGLKAVGLYYGQVEFGKQKGDERLGRELQGAFVRVHSISEGEMGTLAPQEAVERFVRAARERNIRLCYVRLITYTGIDPVAENVEYVQKIARNIARGDEMALGPARPFEETGAPIWMFGLTAVGVAAGGALLLTRLAPVSLPVTWGVLAGLLIVCVGAAAGLGETGRKGVALLAALTFPTLACLRRDVLSQPTVDTQFSPLDRKTSALRAVGGLFVASAVTSLGIAHVIGLLATRPFMLKANQFMGIKAAHVVPILLIGALAIAGLPCLSRPWAEEWAQMRERAARFLQEPTRVGMLLLTLVALAVFALIVARTGNEPGVGVSGMEMKFRALLDRVLPVRPRTKEFLVGHPAFVLALALWFRGRRRWSAPLFVVGVVGQVSILNTFCHIHTPLYLSLVRVVTGLVLGAALGWAVFRGIEMVARDGPR